MKKESRSILVIGSSNHKKATKCIQWGELVYVGDYDLLIVNTVSLTSEVLQKILQSDADYFRKLCKDIADVQQNKGIYLQCILSPYAFSRKGEAREETIDDALRNMINNYSWSPVIPILEKIPPGEKLKKEESLLSKEYLEKIKIYSLLYKGFVNNTGYVDRSKDGFLYTKFHRYSLLENIVGRDVAFGVIWKVHQYGDYNVLVDGHSPIIFVPPTDNVEQGIDILINDYCKEPEEKAPEWINDIVLPGEKEIKDEKNKKILEISVIDNQIKELDEKMYDICRNKKLLYSQGNELEEVVEKALRYLGVNVEKPDISNIEDRYYETTDGAKIYFEIRGVNRLMNESDLTQLIKRIAEKPTSAIYQTRGVYIFNHQNKTKPNDRDNAFHHNIEKSAKGFNICLFDTKSLYALVEAKMKGEQIDGFDQKLLNTVGIFHLVTQ